MSETTLTLTASGGLAFQPIVNLVVDGLGSEHSRRAYSRALADFIAWYDEQGRPGLSKAAVQAYKRKLRDDGLAPATVNQRLAAVRKLAQEAADNGLLDPVLAAGVGRVKGVPSGGRRSGNWLSRDQAQVLLDAPDTSTLKGKRDRAILAVLLGAGLRRAECAALEVGDIQQRDGRWVVLDLVGKRNKVRTVPIPSWTKAALDEWTAAADIDEGLLFRSVRKGDRVNRAGITPQTVRDVVVAYAGEGVAPHDLRRSWAKLAHKGKADLAQIQLSLGHASIRTTERYLGVEQDLHDAPCDKLGLS